MKCSCGVENLADAKFCAGCGRKLEAAAPSAVTSAATAAAVRPAPSAAARPAARKSSPLMIVLLIVVVVAAAAAYWWFNRPEADYVAEDAGLYPVTNGTNPDGTSKMGYIDKSGNMKIEGSYESASLFYDGLALVRQQGKYGFIDTKGQMVVPPQFDAAHPFFHGLAAVKICCGASISPNDQWGFIGKDGKYEINPQFQDAGDFLSSVAPAKLEGKWGLIDKSGKIVVKPTFTRIFNFSEGLAPANESGSRWGFIGKDGKFVITAQFETPGFFREGLAAVRMAGKTGYVDRSGKVVINPQFDSATAFRHGFAIVTVGGKSATIDKSGKFLLNPGQLTLGREEIGDEMIAARNETGWGYVDSTGKWLIQPVAGIETAGRMYQGIALVRIGGESNWINSSGTILWGNSKGQTLANAASSAASESGALAAMRQLLTAEVTYSTTYPQSGYADTLAKLGPPAPGAQPSSEAAALIGPPLSQGETGGYRFTISQVGQGTPVGGFTISATPATGPGRNFCAGADAVIKVAKSGETCDPLNSPPLR